MRVRRPRTSPRPQPSPADRRSAADCRHELLDGRVLECPPHKLLHGVVCGNVAWAVTQHSRRTGFGQVVLGSGILLARDPDTVLGPDVSLFAERRELRELIAAAVQPGYGAVPPVLAAEVLCSEDRPAVVARKIAQYLAAGVLRVWLLDPAARTLVVHAPGAESRTLTEADELTEPADGVPPGFACPVAAFFAA